MPELPDLEVFSKNLNKRLSGKKIIAVTVHNAEQINVTPETLNNQLENAILSHIKREGKTIHFIFSNQQILQVHLMVKGEFDIVPNDAILNSKILSLRFDDQNHLVISDPKNFATVTLNPEPSPIPDALDLTLRYLKMQLYRKKSKKIKAFLIEQTIIRGIGNAYSDEILWISRIAPNSLCGKIPDDAVNALFDAIPTVLKAAIEQIEIAKPNLLKGEYRDFLNIHHPNKTHSPTGGLIHCKKIASRKTYYSDEQRCYS
jgi:formamidopyrimidine-DNA glycosylase